MPDLTGTATGANKESRLRYAADLALALLRAVNDEAADRAYSGDEINLERVQTDLRYVVRQLAAFARTQ